jgi:hypothetical protein
MSHDNNSHNMDRDPPPADAIGDGETGEVMAAIDDNGGSRRLVIADVSTDGSWLSAPTDASVSIAEAR